MKILLISIFALVIVSAVASATCGDNICEYVDVEQRCLADCSTDITNPISFDVTYHIVKAVDTGTLFGSYYTGKISNTGEENIAKNNLAFLITGEEYGGFVTLQNWADGTLTPGEETTYKINTGLSATLDTSWCGKQFTWIIKEKDSNKILGVKNGVLGCEQITSEKKDDNEEDNDEFIVDNPLAFEISYYPIKAGSGGYYSLRLTNHKDYSIKLEQLQLLITGEGHGIVTLQNWAEGQFASTETKRFNIYHGLNGGPGNDACGRDTFTWTIKNRESSEILVQESGVLRCQEIVEKGSSEFDMKYILAKEDDAYTLYVAPSHTTAVPSEIYITAGFISPNAVSSWSNNPTNRYPTTFKYDRLVKAYKIGTLWSGDLYNRYDVLRIYLEYGGDNKEWIIPLDLVQKGNIVKLEPTEEKVINVETDIDKEELPSIKDERKDKEEQVVYLCNGCLLDNKCYPYGFRKDGKFCSDKKEEFVLQLKEEVMCENNFECGSNVCVSGKCVSEGLVEKILNWFKRLFG